MTRHSPLSGHWLEWLHLQPRSLRRHQTNPTNTQTMVIATIFFISFFFFLDEGGSADCWSYQIRLQSSTRIYFKVLKTLLSHWMIHNVAQCDANSTPAHLMTGGVFSVSASCALSVCAHACDQASPHWHHGKNSISILQSHRSSSLDSGLIDAVALSFILQTPLMLSWSLLWHDKQKWGSHTVWIHY